MSEDRRGNLSDMIHEEVTRLAGMFGMPYEEAMDVFVDVIKRKNIERDKEDSG